MSHNRTIYRCSKLPCRVPPEYLEEKRACWPPYRFLRNAFPCAEQYVFGHAVLPPVAFHLVVTRCTAVIAIETRGCSVHQEPSATAQLVDPNSKTYTRLSHHRLMLRAPRQSLCRVPIPQALLNSVTLHKDIQIHQLLNPLLFRQRPGTLPIPTSQQIINQQPI